MAWIDVNGHDIYYTEAGAGQALVFLHGMSSCGEAWWQQFEHFSRRYRVIAYDSINHGHSANSPRGEPEPDRTDELEGFLQALDIKRPILAGNSMGGATILRWAARHPAEAKALVISGMGVRAPGDQPARTVTAIDADTLFLPIGDSLTQRLREERPLMYERYLRIRSTATRLEYMRNPRPQSPRTQQETAQLESTLGATRSPMLVIVGSLDALVPSAQRLHGLVSHAKYHVVDGAPHNVYWEAADEWNREVARFIEMC